MSNINYNIHYSKWHNNSLEHLLKMSRYYLPFQRFFPEGDLNISILDIGCGTGFFVKSCLDSGYYNATGIDISVEQIEVARKHDLPCKHILNTYGFLKDNENNYDVITLFDVIEHIQIESQIELLSAIYSALKPGGKLLIRTPNANAAFSTRFRYIDFTHTSSFTEYSLEFVLMNAGFISNRFQEDFFGRLPIWFPRPSILGLLKSLFYISRRANAIAEFGYYEGTKMPLTLNLISVSEK